MDTIITVEEGYSSGLYTSVATLAAESGCKAAIHSIYVREEFVFQGNSREKLLAK